MKLTGTANSDHIWITTGKSRLRRGFTAQRTQRRCHGEALTEFSTLVSLRDSHEVADAAVVALSLTYANHPCLYWCPQATATVRAYLSWSNISTKHNKAGFLSYLLDILLWLLVAVWWDREEVRSRPKCLHFVRLWGILWSSQSTALCATALSCSGSQIRTWLVPVEIRGKV